MKITKKEIHKIIREELKSIVEAKVDGQVFVDKWEKAMKLAKSARMWSPHMKAKDPNEPVGYTNSDFWGRVPDRYDDMPVFGYHEQSADRAFRSGDWIGEIALGWGLDDDDKGLEKAGKNIVKVLKKAGFKVKWNGSADKKIFLVPG